jgi:hemerythrin-like domain-containing protein
MPSGKKLFFYPAFKERADRDGLKTHAEAVCEHAAVEETAIPRVKAAEVSTPQFAGRVKVFGELIDHHASEEEKTMFKMAKKMFSADELSQFDEQYDQWKTSSEGLQAVAEAKAESERIASGLPAAD